MENSNNKDEIIIEAFDKWIQKTNPTEFIVMSIEGELNAQGILEKMRSGTEFGKNFLQSISNIASKLVPEGVILSVGSKDMNAQEIVEEVESGTEFGKRFFESSLEVVFEMLKKEISKIPKE